MNRYHEHEGRWWFAVGKTPGFDVGHDIDVLDINGVRFKPLESVEITDALACSRAELGPVYVADPSDDNKPKLLLYVETTERWGTLAYYFDGHGGLEEDGANCLSIATPDELKAAGLWND